MHLVTKNVIFSKNYLLDTPVYLTSKIKIMYTTFLYSVAVIFFIMAFLYTVKWYTAVKKQMFKAAHKMATYTFTLTISGFLWIFIAYIGTNPIKKENYSINLKQDKDSIYYIVTSPHNVDTVRYGNLEEFFLEDNI